jgi:hypothetical protein
MSAYLNQVSYYTYSASSKGSGNITIKDGGNSHSIELDEYAIDELKNLADRQFRRVRQKTIESIAALDILPVLTHQDKADAIDAEVVEEDTGF